MKGGYDMSSEETLERFMNDYGDDILRMCYLYLKDYHLAEDAAQDTFIKAMKSYDSFQNQSSEKTWIIRIAINCCKNIMRTRWFRNYRNNLNEDFTESTEDQIDKLLDRECISKAIMQLNEKDRQIILLYYYQELSMKEIAKVIGKSENTTIQRLNRARGKLKGVLMEVGFSG